MRLKYYLRGLGLGIIFAVIIMMIGFHDNKQSMSDTEIIEKAKTLGMVERIFPGQSQTNIIVKKLTPLLQTQMLLPKKPKLNRIVRCRTAKQHRKIHSRKQRSRQRMRAGRPVHRNQPACPLCLFPDRGN